MESPITRALPLTRSAFQTMLRAVMLNLWPEQVPRPASPATCVTYHPHTNNQKANISRPSFFNCEQVKITPRCMVARTDDTGYHAFSHARNTNRMTENSTRFI